MARKKMGVAALGMLTAGLVLSACGSSTPVAQSGASSSVAAAPVQRADLYMVVLTGKMLQKPGWPEIFPADFQVPANTDVTVTVRNYDTGTAPVAAPYATVTGTVGGGEQISGQTITSMDAKQVSHTITVPKLGLNIPIPPATASGPSVVVFTFHTPETAGTYTWQCMVPCGSGTSGWGGAMATDGWMKGQLTVTA